MLLRIIREDWAERFFRNRHYYTGLPRRWERGLRCFFLMKTEVGDSVVGYGVLEDFIDRAEWLRMGGEAHEELRWRTVLVFSPLVRFSKPVPVKSLNLDERLKGSFLHGYRIDEALADRILALAGLKPE